MMRLAQHWESDILENKEHQINVFRKRRDIFTEIIMFAVIKNNHYWQFMPRALD